MFIAAGCEEKVEENSAIKMLCTLWDSVKELIMTCATTKIKVRVIVIIRHVPCPF